MRFSRYSNFLIFAVHLFRANLILPRKNPGYAADSTLSKLRQTWQTWTQEQSLIFSIFQDKELEKFIMQAFNMI